MSLQNSKQISDVKVMLKMGADGAGIASIEKTGTVGVVDTYTITLDDGRKTTFTVTNGSSIASIELTSTSGLVDTYTVTLTNGDTSTFTVTNGSSIESIEKTSTVGLTDTYTITLTNGETSDFTVTNGAGGGSVISVTTDDSELYNEDVTLSKNGTEIATVQFDSTGHAIFRGVEESGTLTLTCTVSGTTATASNTVTVTYYSQYEVTLDLFKATIAVTAPSGAQVSCVGTNETLFGTGSTTFTVHSADTYTITATVDGAPKSTTQVITTDGQSTSVSLEFGTINVTLDSGFVGSSITCTNGTTTITKTSSTTSLTFRPPTTGTWTIIGTIGGTASSVSANVTSLSTPVSVILQSGITINVTMHGAAGATIAYTDVNGNQTATLDSTGILANVSIEITNGMQITFTDTNVSKNPNDLTQNFSKTITMTTATTDVYVMPTENCVYWYGNAEKCEKLSDGGWTAASGYTMGVTGIVYHDNYIEYRPSTISGTATKLVGIGAKNYMRGKTVKMIVKVGSNNNNANQMCAPYAAQSKSSAVRLNLKSMDETLHVETQDMGNANYYYPFWAGPTAYTYGSCFIYALWLSLA